MKKCVVAILLLALLSGCSAAAVPSSQPSAPPIPASSLLPLPTATPEPTPEPYAEDLTASLLLGSDAEVLPEIFLDNFIYTSSPLSELTISSPKPMSFLYFKWVSDPGEYTLEYGGKTLSCGQDGFLHELVALDAPATEVRVSCDAALCDVRAFSAGILPEDVQVWSAPCEKADVLVFPTHADDDTLFFGALISDAVNRGLSVQVCFLTRHDDRPYFTWDREHERLDGLWEMGIKNYPTNGGFFDFCGDSVGECYSLFGTRNVIGWQVGEIRRFKPAVVVGHDLNGEYGHNAHIMNAGCLTEAVPAAADSSAYPDSAELYGVWDAPKLYLHLYKEDSIFIEVNQPLDAFSGRTAAEVAADAYLCHSSQQIYTFAVCQGENEMFDCRLFGLVRSTVGPDTGNDYMENIPA